MKIVILGLRSIGGFAAGGVEKAVEELSTRFVSLGHEVTVVCRARYAGNLTPEYNGVRLKPLPAIYTKHLEAISNTVAAIFYVLRGFDVIHINATGPALLSFIPRLLGKKVIVTVHGLDWKREKWGPFARWVLKVGAWASAVVPQRTIVVSRTLRNHYVTAFGRSTTYIPNGVTLPAAEGTKDVKALGLEDGEYILFLSRLVPEKGCHTLIEAFRTLRTDKKLVIVGPPSHSADYAESLRRLADGDSRIVFTGPLFGVDKDALYRGAYFFVLPSTIEGMALVLLEAMSYGKCCLCSDIDENLEVIGPPAYEPGGHGSLSDRLPMNLAEQVDVANGVWFAVRESTSLAGAMRYLIDHPASVKQVGEKARRHVIATFNWDTIAGQYARVFDSI